VLNASLAVVFLHAFEHICSEKCVKTSKSNLIYWEVPAAIFQHDGVSTTARLTLQDD